MKRDVDLIQYTRTTVIRTKAETQGELNISGGCLDDVGTVLTMYCAESTMECPHVSRRHMMNADVFAE